MASIRVRCSSSHGLFSSVVRWFSNGENSHVDIITPQGHLFGARLFGGVKARNNDIPKHHYTDYIVDIPDEKREAFWFGLFQQRGKKYDIRAIIGWPVRANFNDQDKWFCSELVAWAFHSVDVPLVHENQFHRLSPRDLELSMLMVQVHKNGGNK